MTEIEEILTHTKHRSIDLPTSKWAYYQEWNNALFMHWKVPLDILKNLVPKGLHIDTFEGHAYVSLVAFTMENIRPRYLPSLAFISNFHEINVRTYVSKDGCEGVYFINIEAEKLLSALLAKSMSGLPYEKSSIKRTANSYHSDNKNKQFKLAIDYKIGQGLANKTALDLWLTERYCLYLEEGNHLYRYDIHHKEWDVNTLSIENISLHYSIGDLKLTTGPELMRYSPGVKVVAWKREKI